MDEIRRGWVTAIRLNPVFSKYWGTVKGSNVKKANFQKKKNRKNIFKKNRLPYLSRFSRTRISCNNSDSRLANSIRNHLLVICHRKFWLFFSFKGFLSVKNEISKIDFRTRTLGYKVAGLILNGENEERLRDRVWQYQLDLFSCSH